MKKYLWILLVLICSNSYADTTRVPNIVLKDEGTTQGAIEIFDCVGAGISCAKSGATATLTVSGGSGSGTVNTGVQGYFSYYPSNGTTVDDQTALYSDGTNVGIGTTTMPQKLTVSGNQHITGDLTIAGDDLTMATNTLGALLVGDGTNYNPVVMSGHATIGADGVLALANNSVALSTTTTGNYLAGAAAGAYLDESGSGSEGATSTLSFDPTEIGTLTWGAAAASYVWTWDLAGTDLNLTFGSNLFTFGNPVSISSAGSGTITLGTAGVSLVEDGDGAVTTCGHGDGSDECVTENYDDTSNTKTFSSTTGVSEFDYGTISQDTAGEWRSNGNRIGYNLSVYAAGTAYTITNTPALADFGTTDPSLVIDKAGTYLIYGVTNTTMVNATFAAERTVTYKLRRTNNTAADVSNGSSTIKTYATSGDNAGSGQAFLGPVIYTTSNTDDIIQIFVSIDVVPSVGSITTTDAKIVAQRLY